MRWLAFLPFILFGAVAVSGLAVTLLVERGERLRRLLHPMRLRQAFQPVLIQGGKAQAPPEGAEAKRESRSA